MGSSAKIKVLFVCLGNICRSPMAEAIFKHLVQERGLADRFEIDSAGTSAGHEGEEYHRDTRATVKKHGIAISGQSRPVERNDFSRFDYILAMDTSNYSDLLAACDSEAARKKIIPMLTFQQGDFIPGLDVPDPYYGGIDGFERVFELLEDSCRGFPDSLVADHKLEKARQ